MLFKNYILILAKYIGIFQTMADVLFSLFHSLLYNFNALHFGWALYLLPGL